MAHLRAPLSRLGPSAKTDLRVCADLADMSRRAGEAAVRTINEAVRTAGTCSIVLSGGSTPRTLYRLLASEFRARIPWANVQIIWGDERYLPSEDPRSNYRMAKETLLDLSGFTPSTRSSHGDGLSKRDEPRLSQ
jgi:6-phosphogluconolactonase